MSEENRRKMYEEIKDDPVRLEASGLAEEFGTPKKEVSDPKPAVSVKEKPKAKPKRRR